MPNKRAHVLTKVSKPGAFEPRFDVSGHPDVQVRGIPSETSKKMQLWTLVDNSVLDYWGIPPRSSSGKKWVLKATESLTDLRDWMDEFLPPTAPETREALPCPDPPPAP